MRLLLRLASLLALLAAIIVGGVDAIRYVASDVPEWAAFGAVLAFFGLDQPLVAWVGDGFAANTLQAVFALPGEALFLCVSLVIWLGACQRPKPRHALLAPQS